MGVKPDKILYWIHNGQLPAVNLAQKGRRATTIRGDARRVGRVHYAPVYSAAGETEAGAAAARTLRDFLLKSHLRTYFATLNSRLSVMRHGRQPTYP